MRRVRPGATCLAAMLLVLTMAAHGVPPPRTDSHGDSLLPSVLASKPSLEVSKRVRSILEALRTLRTLAGGADGARPTREARAALARLNVRRR